jgi:trehalose 6-phosphate phosphatase
LDRGNHCPDKEIPVATAVLKSELFLFFEQLARARKSVLLLDYDGTIAPFRTNRHQAFPYAEVPELLDSIMSTCGTRVVLISGRPAGQIRPFLGSIPQPEIWGAHGVERLLPDGRYEALPITEEAAAALRDAAVRLQEEGLGHLCETKRGAVAIHWRGLKRTQIEDIRGTAYRSLISLACQADLRMVEFDGGLELRVRAGNKGHAVRTVLSEVAEDSPVAYLGDDITDEDAFQEVNPRGLTVLVRPTLRTTKAQIWLKPPDELIQFLLDWIHACGGDV